MLLPYRTERKGKYVKYVFITSVWKLIILFLRVILISQDIWYISQLEMFII